MARFNIHYISSSGEPHDEIMDAPDQMALYALLKQRNDTLISAQEADAGAKKGPWMKNISLPFLGEKVKLHDKIIFARNLSAMLEAGLALARALAVIEKQTKQKKFKSVIVNLSKGISQGNTLSESMKSFPDVFPPLMVSMVKAGEESGSLAQSLRVVSNQMESSYQLTRKIRGAMMYPSVVLVAMVGIGFFMLTYVVPTLSATFKEMHAQLPVTTRMILGLSDFLKNNFILALILIAGVVLSVYLGLKTQKGKRFLDYAVLHLPVIGPLAVEINSARTARTLSSLLSAGVDVVVAVRITQDVVQNSYYKEILASVEQKIQKGELMAEVFSEHEKLYPPFVGEMVSVGEETGQLAQMFLGVANFYETEVDQKTKDMSSIVEPILMIVIGVVVGFFAISIISPIYSLGNNIN